MYLTRCQIGYSPPTVRSQKQYVGRHQKQSPHNQSQSANRQPGSPGLRTFAEIGAGQETARNFFQAGGAAGTIAKTISAYDMTFSDQIYGKSKRYVSRERLLTMLEAEYQLLLQRLGESEKERQFFSFANTV